MVKKKRQCDPGDNGDESTESCEENVKSACPHVAKAVDLARLKKFLKIGAFETECVECKKNDCPLELGSDFEIDLTLWMCLRCGSQLCGRGKNKHALQHFDTPHSDCHALSANTTTWEIFCYLCDNETSTSSSKKLHECVEYLKKQASAANSNNSLSPAIELPPLCITGPESYLKPKDKIALSTPRVRGLTNLGNTCFFNSVMQCLVQTPYLLEVLQEMASPGEQFTLPGGKIKLKDEDDGEEKEVDLPPISGELGEWGPLTRTLAETLADLQTGEGGVYNPRKLLNALVTKLPQFGGGDQHDAHELLRHLLEAVRSEDLRRYQSVILSSMGVSSKADPAKVDGEIKQKVKFYGQEASDTMLKPEQVFRGFLVSTLECQDCFHQSDRAEYFLDLSLPLAAHRPQPPALTRRKTIEESNGDENKVSKHQMRKERNAVRKAARKNKGNKSEDNNQGDDDGSKEDGKSSSEQSDADVEDNSEDPAPPKEKPKIPAVADTAANFATYHLESNYNSEKLMNSDSKHTSPVDLDKEKTDSTPERLDKEITFENTNSAAIPLEYKPLVDSLSNPDSGVASPEGTKHNSTETVDNVDSPVNGKELNSHDALSIDINLELSNPQNMKLSPVKSEFERPVSRISFAPEYTNEVISRGISVEGCKNVLEHSGESSYESFSEKPQDNDNNIYSTLKSKIENLSLDTDDYKDDCSRPSYPSPEAADSLDQIKRSVKGKRDVFTRPSTFSQRYVYDEDECVIEQCLAQFTALELLTGNNKVTCQKCTERINGKNGKNVYTNATKRFLISSPPAILILHLKRFQIGPRGLFRKMSKHVDFPAHLNLADFCAMDKVRKLPNVNKNQSELLYSLYGVVEHSGSMHGGHYVAYVKLRAPVKPGDPRWWFLPKGANTSPSTEDGDSDTSLSGYESGDTPASNVKAPKGKWYYISDSMVTEVTEAKVFEAQAYLLFYERIL